MAKQEDKPHAEKTHFESKQALRNEQRVAVSDEKATEPSAEETARVRSAVAVQPQPMTAPSSAAVAAKQKASAPGCTLCRVTGTAIKHNGHLIPEGTVAEFDDATVLSMPTVLVSVE